MNRFEIIYEKIYRRIYNGTSDQFPLNVSGLLIQEERERVNGELYLLRRFYGGPLDLRHHGINDSWLSPIEVKTKPQSSYSLINFDVVRFGDRGLGQVELDLTPDDEYKLGQKSSPIRNSGTLIRVNPNQLYFPVFPNRRGLPDLDSFRQIINVLSRFLGEEIIYDEQKLPDFLDWYNLDPIKMEKIGDFLIRRRYIGDFSVFDVLDEALESKFPFFQIYFKNQQELIGKKELPIRIDSGCQIGQIYDDGGCDCLSQFRRALDGGYYIFHLPIQDGRGWGMLTKMKTEELKRNGLDTIEAARSFFGDGISYDIRDYTVVPRFLSSLGVSSVVLNTDNRRKLEAFKDFGIEVERAETDTEKHCQENPELLTHIRAKHATDDYF